MGLEDLKNELIAQKSAIENKGGSVSVTNLNPSPSEITAGISTIPFVNVSLANATSQDVLLGKTFYAGGTELKTGTYEDQSANFYKMFFFNDSHVDFADRINFYTPTNMPKVKAYLFKGCYNPIDVYFTGNITEILEYAFYDTPNFRFPNFSNTNSIATIGDYAFFMASHTGIDVSNLPPCITKIGSRSFGDFLQSTDDLVIPSTVVTVGTYAFSYNSARKCVNSVTINSTCGGTLPTGMLAFEAFNCDFRPIAGIHTINGNFNYRGCFNNITIPTTISYLKDYCFGSTSSDPTANYYLRSVTFENPIPPSIGKQIFAVQNKDNGNFKIYVPDEAVDAYKAISNLKSYYLDYIYPISQKP